MGDRPGDLSARPNKGQLGGGRVGTAGLDGAECDEEVIGGGGRIPQSEAELAGLQVGPVRRRCDLERPIDRRRRVVRASSREQGGRQERVDHGVIRGGVGRQAELLDGALDMFMCQCAKPLVEGVPGAHRRGHSSSSRAIGTGTPIRPPSRPCHDADALTRLQAAIPSGVRTVVATLIRTTAA